MLRCSALALLAAACAAPPAPRADLRWDHEAGRSLALVRAGADVWRCHFGPDRSKPCFHPLALPDGLVLTQDMPGDHRWHHGLWFSWKYIDGVNYWENDGRTGRPVGRTSWAVAALDTNADGSARLVLDLAYAPPDGAPVLHERRVLATTPPQPDGSFTIDWQGTFTAARACVLDRTPMPGENRGQPNGGYAGLGLRLADFDARDATTEAGPVTWNEHDRTRPRAAAFDYGGTLGGRAAGVAVLEHPANPGAPNPWYAVRTRGMTFANAAWLAPSPRRLAAGETFVLRYRVCVHPGRFDGPRLRQALAEYAPSSPLPR